MNTTANNPIVQPPKNTTRRFMVIVKASKNSEAGVLPSQNLLAEMGKFNEDLSKAGVLAFTPELQAQEERLRAEIRKGESR
jgi:hypothetical protein